MDSFGVDNSGPGGNLTAADPIPRDVVKTASRSSGVQVGAGVTGLDPSMIAWLARLWSETSRTLDLYQAHVNEGQDLMAGLEFARYVLWSGIVPLCKSFAQDCPKIDGAYLQWKAEELQRSVQDVFIRARGAKVELAETQLESINRKLDLIAGRLSILEPGRAERVRSETSAAAGSSSLKAKPSERLVGVFGKLPSEESGITKRASNGKAGSDGQVAGQPSRSARVGSTAVPVAGANAEPAMSGQAACSSSK